MRAAVERSWTTDDAAARLLRLVLVPASGAYGAVVALRNRLYDAGWLAAARVPARVLSVGNLTVGGTGKTPAALWLAERLVARGHRVALVARGYRKERRGVVVVGADGTPLVTPAEGGDEAVLLARRFRGPVLTGERRALAAQEACARFGVDTIVLDDGFQHRALARDADLVLVADDPAAARLLPAGSRREPEASLARARAILAMGDGPAPTVSGAPVFRGRLVPTAVVRAAGGQWREGPLDELAGLAVVAVAGVARPHRFVATLHAAGARVVRELFFPDHHAYGPGDLAAIAAAAYLGRLVTTEKDLVKLERHTGLRDLAALRVSLEVTNGEALVTALAGGSEVAFDGHTG